MACSGTRSGLLQFNFPWLEQEQVSGLHSVGSPVAQVRCVLSCFRLPILGPWVKQDKLLCFNQSAISCGLKRGVLGCPWSAWQHFPGLEVEWELGGSGSDWQHGSEAWDVGGALGSP